MCTRPRRRTRRARRQPRSRRDRCGSGNRRCPRPGPARRARGKAPGAAGLIDDRRVGRQRLLDRPDDLELLVVDLDALEGRCGGGLVFRCDCGDRLAGKPHTVDRHHRPVADGVTPVGIDVGEVSCGQDADDAGHSLRVARVDGRDPPVGVGRAQDLSVQHARHEDVTGELRLATQLLVGVAARDRLPDRAWADLHFLDPAHAVTPASSQTASRIPR